MFIVVSLFIYLFVLLWVDVCLCVFVLCSVLSVVCCWVGSWCQHINMCTWCHRVGWWSEHTTRTNMDRCITCSWPEPVKSWVDNRIFWKRQKQFLTPPVSNQETQHFQALTRIISCQESLTQEFWGEQGRISCWLTQSLKTTSDSYQLMKCH